MKQLFIAALALAAVTATAADFVPAKQPLCHTSGEFTAQIVAARNKFPQLSAAQILQLANKDDPSGADTNAMGVRWAFEFAPSADQAFVVQAIEQLCLAGKLRAH